MRSTSFQAPFSSGLSDGQCSPLSSLDFSLLHFSNERTMSQHPQVCCLYLSICALPKAFRQSNVPSPQSPCHFLPLFTCHQGLSFSPLHDLLSQIALFHGFLPLALSPISLSLFPSRPFLHPPWISEKFSLAFILKMFSLSVFSLHPHFTPTAEKRPSNFDEDGLVKLLLSNL